MARYVNPSRARLHIADLRSWGISYRTIGHMTGMTSVGQVNGIVHDAQKIRWETERRILRARFDLDDIPEEHQLLVDGTRRRVQALVRIGWSQKEIGERAGLSPANMGKLLHYRGQRYITARLARQIRDVYADLSMTPGPNLRARLLGERRDWPPPLAWDDDTIDHPDTQPHDVARSSAALTPSSDTADEVEWYLRNVNSFATESEIAARFGTSQGSVYQALRRATRDDLAKRLHENAARIPAPATKKEHAA